MSIESAKAFIERIKTDEEFAKQVASKKDKEDRMKFVSEQGFDFTEGEIKDQTAELSEDELKQVNGGITNDMRFYACYWDFTPTQRAHDWHYKD